MSRKWTTGAGPRITCVRDYPSELQFKALEHVNLSPKVDMTSPTESKGPIPSPRPSPGLRLSPRLASMALPTPTISLTLPNLKKRWFFFGASTFPNLSELFYDGLEEYGGSKEWDFLAIAATKKWSPIPSHLFPSFFFFFYLVCILTLLEISDCEIPP